ncbi:MAG: aminoglycoside phosphotransferase family protein [Chloroflexi bacterium]|nr:aminoglycoside phosphotransferase family protein [Chloroflexota bacterium]
MIGEAQYSDDLKSVFAKAAGFSPAALRFTLRPSLDHQSNNLYDVQANHTHWILKEYLKEDEWEESPCREFEALNLLKPLGIAPRPLFFEPLSSSHKPLVAYEFMAGEMWDRCRPTETQLAQLARAWLAMNTLPTENLWRSRGFDSLTSLETRLLARAQHYRAWVESEFPSGRRAAEILLTECERRHPIFAELSADQPPLCFCRADPRFANVIQQPNGEIGLVDWEDSGLRDPAIDLADLITHPNQEDLLAPDEWNAFFQLYLAVRSKFDTELSRRIHLYQAIFQLLYGTRILIQAVEQMHKHQPIQSLINEMPIQTRLRRYWARMMAYPATDFSSQLEKLANTLFFPQ